MSRREVALAADTEAVVMGGDAGPLGEAGFTRSLGSTPGFWFSMLAASALGTNLGDLLVDEFGLARGVSFAILSVVTAVAFGLDRAFARRSDAGFWIVIVTLRAAATNVGDFLAHDLALSSWALIVGLGGLTLLAGRFTLMGTKGRGTPEIDWRYWTAMAIAGVFGTVGGDLSSHVMGLYAAAGALCLVTVLLVVAYGRLASTPVVAYWVVVLAERCAGTPLGDAFASHRALNLGVPGAMACTGGLLAAGLLMRARERR